MDRWFQLDWPRLSNIGQAYGLASAIFSILAVVGVAVSLAHQSLGIVVQRDQDISDAHARLPSLVLSDPQTFGPVLSDKAQRLGIVEYERYVSVTLVLRLALSGYETGHTNEYSLRNEVTRGLFLRSVGREHWRESRTFWLSASLPHHRQFARIADEEYQAAISRGPALPIPPHTPAPAPAAFRARLAPALAAGVAGGLIGVLAVAATRRRPSATDS
ncbi:DUF6082 family protein [Catenuloplanes indicus]|uniref:Uncharacterized protein n=1 Tax=Catenuloplanes indicus TaxID=137267 RepID=A0AAE3W7Y6_9ACTN|nr:DUF6082 family protein [Catenuloplanes indicus]MDQ0370120.1 hypothetical protein [Catenuloplanes indicus]